MARDAALCRWFGAVVGCSVRVIYRCVMQNDKLALLVLVAMVVFGCKRPSVTIEDVHYATGQLVHVVDGVFEGRDAVIGLPVGDGVYQLNHIKGKPGECDYIGTLRDCEVVPVGEGK